MSFRASVVVGTTQKFLEHFGINTIDELPGSQELKRAMPKHEKKITSPIPEVELN